MRLTSNTGTVHHQLGPQPFAGTDFLALFINDYDERYFASIREPKITGAPGQMAPEIALRAFRLSRD